MGRIRRPPIFVGNPLGRETIEKRALHGLGSLGLSRKSNYPEADLFHH
jgi:hypothetical protein